MNTPNVNLLVYQLTGLKYVAIGSLTVEGTRFPVISAGRAKEWRVIQDMLRTNMYKLTT